MPDSLPLAGSTTAKRLREHLARPGLLLAPGAADALSARLIERAGYPLCYFTGAGFANSQFALPDVGLISFAEVVEQVRRITGATTLPVIADADAGYGNALNVIRTVQEFERAGAAGVQLEDQVTPKRCGHFPDKALVSTAEMVRKIEAAATARRDRDFVIVARTDARAVEGLDAAISRLGAYRAAGADVLFVEAPPSIEELRAVPGALGDVPCLVNLVPGGRTPLARASELESFGYRIAIYPNVVLQVAIRCVRAALDRLRTTGDPSAIVDQMITWEERQALVDLPAYEALAQRFLQGAPAEA